MLYRLVAGHQRRLVENGKVLVLKQHRNVQQWVGLCAARFVLGYDYLVPAVQGIDCAYRLAVAGHTALGTFEPCYQLAGKSVLTQKLRELSSLVPLGADKSYLRYFSHLLIIEGILSCQ